MMPSLHRYMYVCYMHTIYLKRLAVVWVLDPFLNCPCGADPPPCVRESRHDDSLGGARGVPKIDAGPCQAKYPLLFLGAAAAARARVREAAATALRRRHRHILFIPNNHSDVSGLVHFMFTRPLLEDGRALAATSPASLSSFSTTTPAAASSSSFSTTTPTAASSPATSSSFSTTTPTAASSSHSQQPLRRRGDSGGYANRRRRDRRCGRAKVRTERAIALESAQPLKSGESWEMVADGVR